MPATNGVYTKHLVRSVSPSNAVPVQLLVGDKRYEFQARRPRHFTDMTLLSASAYSRRTDMGTGPRALIKHAIGRWSQPIDVEYFLDTRDIDPNNISHLLMELIPLCLCAKNVFPDAVFIFRNLGPPFRQLLAHFGITPICTYRPIRGKQLTFRLSRGLSQYEIGLKLDAPIYSYINEIYSDYVGAGEGSSRIFISRRGIRAPTNLSELHACLEGRGFRVVYLEDYPISEQIALIQGAQDIVAIHGAAIAYLALKEHTRTIIELFPPNVHHDHFPVGLGHKVENFYQLIPSFDDDVQFQGWSAIFDHKQRPFKVDLPQLERVLDSVVC